VLLRIKAISTNIVMATIQKTIACIICACLFVLLGACKASEPTLPVPVEQLAVQIYLPIGTRVFRLPLVALVSHLGSSEVYQPSKLSSESKVTNTAIQIHELTSKYSVATVPRAGITYATVRLNTFSYLKDTQADTTVPTTGLCTLLREKQKWAFELCSGGLMDGKNAFAVNNFILMDDEQLKETQPVLGYYAGRKESVGEAVLAMAPYTTEPKVFCGVGTDGKQSTLCTVVMRLDQDLLAIWTTNTTSIEKDGIALESKSIRAFVEHGIGETENYEALQTRLKGLHRRARVE
jgi:hypothetical protein